MTRAHGDRPDQASAHRESAGGDRPDHGFTVVVVAIVGVVHAAVGTWAFVGPRSFYDTIATFPPYNVHFLHDIGAFLLGIGAAFMAALVWRDGLLVALLGGTTAAVFHWISHVMDRELGGSASDPWTLGAFALLLLAGLIARFRARDAAATDRPLSGRRDGAR